MKNEQFWCSKCRTSIGGHNQYLHDGMCDDCFFEKYFPEEAQIMEIDIEQIRRHCRSNPVKKENFKFKEFLEATNINKKIINKIVMEIESKVTCPNGGECCKILKPTLKKEDIDKFFMNAERCPVIFNVLENAKEEFLEEIYAFENPNV